MPQPPTWALAVADAVRYFNLRPWQPRLSLDGKAEHLADRVKRLRASWTASRLSNYDRAVSYNQSLLEAAFHHFERAPLPNDEIIGALLSLGLELALQNHSIVDFPTVDLSRSLTAAESREVTDALIELQTRIEHDDHIHDLYSHGMCALFVGIVDEMLPRAAFEGGSSVLTVPLYSLIDVSRFTSRLLGFFLHDLVPDADHIGGLAFANTRLQLWQNLLAVSRATFEQIVEAPHKVVTPDNCKLEPQDLLTAYLAHTPFIALANTDVPFNIPRKTYASHGIIVAPPNHGKTQFLGSLCNSFLQEDDPPGLIVLDPHGDLFKKMLSLDVFHPEHGRLKDRLLVLDPDDPSGPPALNFLDFGSTTETGAYQTFSYLMNSLSSDLSAKQTSAAIYLLKLLRHIPNASLDALRQLVDDKARSADASNFRDAINALPAFEQDYFRNQFFDNRMQETKQAIGWKLYNILANDTFRRMFSAPRNSFDAYDAMQQKKIVLVNGASDTLGREGMAVFLQFIVGQFYAASFKRGQLPEEQRHLCLLMVDEAHYVFNDQIKSILTECRKFGLGFLAATQLIEQMTPEVKAAVYGATAIRIAGPVSHGDATALAREMYCDADFIRSMNAVERSHSDWAVQVAGLTDKRAIRLTLPFGALENALLMDKPALAKLREINRNAVGSQTDEAPTTNTTPPLANNEEAPEAAVATSPPAFEIKPGKDW